MFFGDITHIEKQLHKFKIHKFKIYVDIYLDICYTNVLLVGKHLCTWYDINLKQAQAHLFVT